MLNHVCKTITQCILVLTCTLSLISYQALAGEWKEDRYVSDYATIGKWQVKRYAMDAQENQTDYCSAVMYTDHINAIRLARYYDGYSFGFNGLSPENNLAPFGSTEPKYPVDYWFNHDRATTMGGYAIYLRDQAYPDDHWLSHFEPNKNGPINAISTSQQISFEFPNAFDHQRLVQSHFDLSDANTVLNTLDNCINSHGPIAGTKPASTVMPAQACPDDGPRLPQSGVCQGRGVNYLNFTTNWQQPLTPDGCDWVLQETKISFENKYLLYLALRCNGVTSKLEFGAGAHMATLTLSQSAFGLTDMKIADVHHVEHNDPKQSILQRASYLASPAEFQGCSVRQHYDIPEAYVVDVSPAQAARAPQDEPRLACGPYGLRDSESYWRVLDNQIYFFDLGQDAYRDIDVETMTVYQP